MSAPSFYLFPFLVAIVSAKEFTNGWSVKISSSDEVEARRVAKEINSIMKGERTEMNAMYTYTMFSKLTREFTYMDGVAPFSAHSRCMLCRGGQGIYWVKVCFKMFQYPA